MDKKTSQYFYILSALAIALQTVLLFADIRQFPLSSHTVAKYYFVVEDHDFFRLAHIDEEGEPEFIDDGILFINHHIMKKLYNDKVPYEEWDQYLLHHDYDSYWKINIRATEGKSVQETITKLWEKK
ncbi:MAG: hypothetical protein VXV96_16230 [Bdellovibrionota bacterium]|jgi:hypothetical protein|nr:hypothetical protein [Bdellovibrionota bacterium]